MMRLQYVTPCCLQLSQYCPGHQRPDVSHAQPPFPAMGVAPSNGATGAADGVWVDCENGSDSAAGTKEHPLRSIHAGVAKARATKGGGAVIVRAGTCYLSAPIALDGADSGLTISNAPGEEVWISGGVPLGSLQWERPTASLKLPQRVWVTDLSSLGLSDIASLRVDGARREPARYPNANPETQFWPVGYLTSKESFVPKGDWLKPSIAPSPNPATVVNISSPNRAFDSQFSFYRGGIGVSVTSKCNSSLFPDAGCLYRERAPCMIRRFRFGAKARRSARGAGPALPGTSRAA